MIDLDEKFRMKKQEEEKEDYVTISRLDFLKVIASVIASLDADREESDSLAIFGAMIAGKIFDKQKSDESEEEK